MIFPCGMGGIKRLGVQRKGNYTQFPRQEEPRCFQAGPWALGRRFPGGWRAQQGLERAIPASGSRPLPSSIQLSRNTSAPRPYFQPRDPVNIDVHRLDETRRVCQDVRGGPLKGNGGFFVAFPVRKMLKWAGNASFPALVETFPAGNATRFSMCMLRMACSKAFPAEKPSFLAGNGAFRVCRLAFPHLFREAKDGKRLEPLRRRRRLRPRRFIPRSFRGVFHGECGALS